MNEPESRLDSLKKMFMNTPAELDLLLGSKPERLADWAKKQDKTKQLAEMCVATLQAIGEMPEPEDARKDYLKTPPEDRQVDVVVGDYWGDCRRAIRNYLESTDRASKPIFLDVGGRHGEIKAFSEGFDYWLMDLELRAAEADRMIEADICKPIPLEAESVDVICSHMVWEHLERPWLACHELGRILKPGGLFVTVTLFSYRYHPFPADHFRYSHSGLASIHEEFAKTRTVTCQYDLRFRRVDHRGGAELKGRDLVPVDWFGGFRENWVVYYIGKKAAQ